MAFYHLTLHAWLLLVRPGDFDIRLLSTVFAVAAVPALYLLGTELFDPAVGLAAAILLAVNPLFISYAQEARSYTLTVFLAVMSWLFLIRCCREPQSLNFAKYIAAATLTIYSHNLAMLMLPAQGATILFIRGNRGDRVRLISAVCAVCVLALPLFPIAAHWYHGDADWIAASMGRPGLRALREVAISFAGGIPPPRIRQRLLEALFAAGFLMCQWQFAVAFRKRSADTGSYECVAFALGVPIGLLMAVSQVFPIFIVRYVLISLPFFLLITAAGWSGFRRRWVGALGLTLLVLLCLWSDQAYYSHPDKPAWRAAIRDITNNACYGDELAFVPAYGRFPFEYNLRGITQSPAPITIIYPRWNSVFEMAGQYVGSPALMNAALKRACPRLWIVQSHLTGSGAGRTLNGIISRYPIVLHKEFRGISVFLCAYRFQSRGCTPNGFGPVVGLEPDTRRASGAKLR
jgi:hypothetical protein